MFTRAFFTTLMVGFLAVGCASKKPKNSQDDAAMNGEGSNSGLTLELNGSSDSGTAGGLKTVYFAYDSASFDSETREVIKNNADYLKSNASVDVQIEGHADERGSKQYNLALGERRAKAVKEQLVVLGVPAKRITTISYGSEQPAQEGSSETSWSKNRRANFVITAK